MGGGSEGGGGAQGEGGGGLLSLSEECPQNGALIGAGGLTRATCLSSSISDQGPAGVSIKAAL